MFRHFFLSLNGLIYFLGKIRITTLFRLLVLVNQKEEMVANHMAVLCLKQAFEWCVFFGAISNKDGRIDGHIVGAWIAFFLPWQNTDISSHLLSLLIHQPTLKHNNQLNTTLRRSGSKKFAMLTVLRRSIHP